MALLPFPAEKRRWSDSNPAASSCGSLPQARVLLGHKNGDITTHYSAAELRELIEAVQKIDASQETPMITVLRPVECSCKKTKGRREPALSD